MKLSKRGVQSIFFVCSAVAFVDSSNAIYNKMLSGADWPLAYQIQECVLSFIIMCTSWSMFFSYVPVSAFLSYVYLIDKRFPPLGFFRLVSRYSSDGLSDVDVALKMLSSHKIYFFNQFQIYILLLVFVIAIYNRLSPERRFSFLENVNFKIIDDAINMAERLKVFFVQDDVTKQDRSAQMSTSISVVPTVGNEARQDSIVFDKTTYSPCPKDIAGHRQSQDLNALDGLNNLLANKGVFFVMYMLMMIPTYVLPYFGSNSLISHGIDAISASAGGPTMLPIKLIHLGALAALCVFAFLRGRMAGKPWLVALPILATIFDFVPTLNWVPLVPTVMHILTLFIGISSSSLIQVQQARAVN